MKLQVFAQPVTIYENENNEICFPFLSTPDKGSHPVFKFNIFFTRVPPLYFLVQNILIDNKHYIEARMWINMKEYFHKKNK